jgi:hypothetical protein
MRAADKHKAKDTM